MDPNLKTYTSNLALPVGTPITLVVMAQFAPMVAIFVTGMMYQFE